jgi:hypothetical protein
MQLHVDVPDRKNPTSSNWPDATCQTKQTQNLFPPSRANPSTKLQLHYLPRRIPAGPSLGIHFQRQHQSWEQETIRMRDLVKKPESPTRPVDRSRPDHAVVSPGMKSMATPRLGELEAERLREEPELRDAETAVRGGSTCAGTRGASSQLLGGACVTRGILPEPMVASLSLA